MLVFITVIVILNAEKKRKKGNTNPDLISREKGEGEKDCMYKLQMCTKEMLVPDDMEFSPELSFQFYPNCQHGFGV